MVKALNISISGTLSPMILKLGMEHRGLKLYKVYIDDDPGLTSAHISISAESLQVRVVVQFDQI